MSTRSVVILHKNQKHTKMNRINTIQKDLEKFGLSQNQALIYLLLVEHKQLRVQEITNLTHIPRSSVYENLKALFRLGLAQEIVEENYRIIKPYPVGALHHSLNEKMASLKELSSQLASIEQSFKVDDNETKSATAAVKYYKNKSGARQLLWNTLKTTSTVCVYSEFGRSEYVGKKFYQDFVSQSSVRHIQEHVLINPTERALGIIKKDAGTTLARTKPNAIRTIEQKKLTIRGETFIYDDTYAQIYLDKGEINGFEIESPYFVETQISIFKTLWNLAQSLQLN